MTAALSPGDDVMVHASLGRLRRFEPGAETIVDATAPLTSLLENDGKILLLGVDYKVCSIFHLAEERDAAPENFYKTFEGVLVDGDRVLAPITQRYFVRRDMAVKKDPEPASRMLEDRGQVTELPLGDGVVRAFSAQDFDARCMQVLAKNHYACSKPDRT